MQRRELSNFVCECLPHTNQLEVINYVRRNPNKTAEELIEHFVSHETGNTVQNAIEIDDDVPTTQKSSRTKNSKVQTTPISNSLLKQLNQDRKQRIGNKPQGVTKQRSPASELELARRKLKQKWRDTTPTARSMTISDLGNREKLEQRSKAGDWGESNSTPKFQTLETLLYDVQKIGKESLTLTNEFRKKQGLKPLVWSQALCTIGQGHSKDMGDGKVPFGHAGFDKRVKAYPFQSSSAAENVAMNSGSSNIAQVAVDGWINSPGHRKNLLSNTTYCGIGVYRNDHNQFYLTQLFG
jgi:uncharacterized protein YkwD